MNKIAPASKRQQENLSTVSLDCESDVLTTTPSLWIFSTSFKRVFVLSSFGSLPMTQFIIKKTLAWAISYQTCAVHGRSTQLALQDDEVATIHRTIDASQ